MKAIDTPINTVGRAHQIKEQGIEAVGFYLRPDRSSQAMLDGLKEVSLARFSIFERGSPTHGSYFSVQQSRQDARDAYAQAQNYHQPKGSPIFFTVDYDCTVKDRLRILSYFAEVHNLLSPDYLVGVYGSGWICQVLIAKGLAHYGYLAGSTAFEGYQSYLHQADIVQTSLDQTLNLPEVKDKNGNVVLTLLELDVDEDLIQNSKVLW